MPIYNKGVLVFYIKCDDMGCNHRGPDRRTYAEVRLEAEKDGFHYQMEFHRGDYHPKWYCRKCQNKHKVMS